LSEPRRTAHRWKHGRRPVRGRSRPRRGARQGRHAPARTWCLAPACQAPSCGAPFRSVRCRLAAKSAGDAAASRLQCDRGVGAAARRGRRRSALLGGARRRLEL